MTLDVVCYKSAAFRLCLHARHYCNKKELLAVKVYLGLVGTTICSSSIVAILLFNCLGLRHDEPAWKTD